MQLEPSISKVSEKYIYTNGPGIIKDAWFVMRSQPNGYYYGDCEDFSLTVFWYVSGGGLAAFLKNILTGEVKLHIVASDDGSGNNHCVGEYKGLWLDNWTQQALPKALFFESTGHVYGHRFNPLVVMCKLFVGLFYR